MPWFNVWDGLKNKTCRYLLQRYLGQFLEEKLNLEQLKVELYNGKATVKNVSLKVEALNDLFDAQGWDVEVIGGHVGVLTVIVPWNALMTNDSSIEITDLVISLRPIKRQSDGTSMLESMWSSVTSSMQLAEECMKQKDDDGSDEPLEINTNSIAGLEKFAETIDNVLNRIKAKFTNTILRLEYPSMDGSKCIAIVMKIEKFDYKNETGSENLFQNLHDNSGEDSKSSKSEAGPSLENAYLFPTFAKHNIVLSGLKLYTEEFKLPQSDLNSHVYKINCNNSNTKIPILEIHNQQKIEIKMKQSEEISGAKVSFDAELGSIYYFLSPRQIHLLIQFWNAFLEDDSRIPLNVKDNKSGFQSIRTKNIHRNIEPCKTHMSGNLVNHGNWGEDYDERSLPQNVLESFPPDNIGLKSNRYCDSLSSSISSNSTTTGASRFQRKIANMESCGEILHFNIIIASFIGIVLHEDILVESNVNMSDNPLNEGSQFDLIHIAENFFTGLKKNPSYCFNLKNHIYLGISSLVCNGTKKRIKNMLSSVISVSATKFDFCEVLDDGSSPLILFDRIQNCPDGYRVEPEIILNIKSTFSCSLREVSNIAIDLSLERNTLELDISIYDRLSNILGPSPFLSKKTAQLSSEKKLNVPPKSYVDLKINSKLLKVKLRFPVVDARPIHDPDRVPWWKQNIRPDFMLISFDQFRFHFCESTLDVVANEISAYYCEKSIETKVHLLKSSFVKEEHQLQTDKMLNYPKVTIRVPSYEILSNIKFNYTDNDCEENSDMYTNVNHCNLPFSSKRVCRESDTLHNKRDDAESETVLLPGETKEINTFCNSTMNSSKIQIQINLPMVNLALESKQLYETIYNRLNTDIFMWEPSSPILTNSKQDISQLEQSIYNVGMMDSMYVPSTASQDPYECIDEKYSPSKFEGTENDLLSSGSDGSESNSFFGTDPSESIYFSIHGNERHKPEIKTTKANSSDFSFEIKIANGLMTAFAPVRDAENHVLPEQYGKFDIKITNLCIFFVNGFKSNENLSYLCFQLSDVEVYHCGLIPKNSPSELQYLNTDIEPFMKSMFYKVPCGLTKGNGTGYKDREMITLVIEIKKLTDQKLKRLRITTGIQQLTLRHEPAPSSHFWFNQLNDFLNVLDYPIEGYQPFGIITEIQLHMWDCAIDYRPKNLAYRAVMEIGSFTISSNIISAVTGCNLRFVVEDCVLSIAPYENSCEYPDHKITFIESINLVPVLDIGLLDISLRLSDSNIEKCPKLDLRCSVHDAHLRTCSDSGCALAQLIAHIANDEDIIGLNSEDSVSLQSSACSDAEILSAKANTICLDLSQKQQERVNLMMAEAVKENVTSPETFPNERTLKSTDHGIEVFYFPDENSKLYKEPNLDSEEARNEYCDILNFESNVMKTSYYTNLQSEDTLPQVKTDLGDIKNSSKCNNKLSLSQEEDYCIIAEEEKGFMSHCGIKNVRISDDPLRIVDNHFCLPTGKPDLLRSPESFPVAVLRYTLCEMTVTWHLYGGKDFPDNFPSTNSKKVKIETSRMSEAYKYGVSYTKGIHSIHFGKKPKETLTWKSRGGQQRNHEVLVEMQFSKVRFSHEIYPAHTSHASRQVLLINEIEIRDRLQSSDINKFLYYPNMKNLSNKSPQHMVVIKALHVRPNPERSTAQECSLRISLLPMRLHVDQDTLIFLADYFTNIGDNSENHIEIDNKSNKLSQTVQQDPIITVNDVPEAVHDLRARKLISTNLDLLMDNDNLKGTESSNVASHVPVNDESSPIYFREVIFSPEVPICFDYHGRRVELSRGPIAGLLMGLGQLQCSEIRLRKIIYRRGLLGFEKLLTHMCKKWLKDIKRNQLPKILSGVGPTHAFLQFFQGIYDLFWLPIEQYQKDGRIMRGLQLGAQSFSARTALAALEITSRIIQLLQFTAETAFDMVSPGPSVRINRKLRKGKKRRPHRPKDIREGVTNAYLIMKEGIHDSANTLIETAVAEHDQKGYTGAVGAVMRQIPQLVVCPAVLATQATTNILGGVKSSLVPDAKTEAREKWKDDSD